MTTQKIRRRRSTKIGKRKRRFEKAKSTATTKKMEKHED